jgi:hypothetical protein
MEHDEQRASEWFEQALWDPGSVFSSPEAVTDCPDLTLEEKVRVLLSWEYDATELAVADEEGMQGAENGLVRRVLLALTKLTGGKEVERVAPTKQHGLL